ncbi:MAG: phosphoribosylanthranilate isomerase [Spirochaetaceae bacterium]|jgi:phosphoribosylanthranilate isomerase|nr:phosphoribosylanthranilate isomerase [Spirochaetaceae bacterium]
MIKIKICGLFREKDIDYANEAAPDYVGFVFASESRRRIRPGIAAAFREKLRKGIVPVGVFVNAAVDEIAALCRDGVIAMVQLHGGETDGYIDRLRERCGAPLIRAAGAESLEKAALSGSFPLCGPLKADYLLLDNGNGGTGRSFDWKLLDILRTRIEPNGSSGTVHRGKAPKNPAPPGTGGHLPQNPVPVFLAGGIGFHNIEAALTWKPYAVDISTGAETDGIKDREKMIGLVQKVRTYRGSFPG